MPKPPTKTKSKKTVKTKKVCEPKPAITDLPSVPALPVVAKKIKNKDNYYVNPSEFHQEIVTYYIEPMGTKPSDSLGSKIMKIANRLSYLGKFQGYTYREEMANLAIERMLHALLRRKYDVNKGNNPFSYFTRIAWNSFRATIKDEKAYGKVLDQYTELAYDSQYEYGNGYENVRRRKISDE